MMRNSAGLAMKQSRYLVVDAAADVSLQGLNSGEGFFKAEAEDVNQHGQNKDHAVVVVHNQNLASLLPSALDTSLT